MPGSALPCKSGVTVNVLCFLVSCCSLLPASLLIRCFFCSVCALRLVSEKVSNSDLWSTSSPVSESWPSIITVITVRFTDLHILNGFNDSYLSFRNTILKLLMKRNHLDSRFSLYFSFQMPLSSSHRDISVAKLLW